MTVSLESKEERDVLAAARVPTPVIVERPKSEMQARRSLLTRILALIKGHQRQGNIRLKITTHPFQISMDEVEAMHICETLRDINELNTSVKDPYGSDNAHTSSARSTLGFFWMKSLMFPSSIHSETIANRRPVSITPNSGRMFGCRRFFQATTSRQNLYNSLVQADRRYV